MTDERTLERAARSFIEAGPTRAPEAAVEAALARIQTTPQERDWHVLRRFAHMPIPTRVAAAVALGVLAIGASTLLLGRPSQSNVGGPSPSAAEPSATASAAPARSTVVQTDYSALEGTILLEHLGNALDLSESTAQDYNPDTRRFYFIDPADMTARTVTEFLKGSPATGKSAADISADGERVVFQDWTDNTRLYEANLDGSGFRRIPLDCTCDLLYPDYDPTATRIVYTRMQGAEAWLEILDLATNETTKIEATVGPSSDDVPEQPAWSPDGKTIAFTSLHWAGRNDPIVGTVRYGDQPPESGKLMVVDVATGTVSDLAVDPSLVPGDANWSPDSTSLVFAAGAFSATGSVSSGMPHAVYRVEADGTGLRKLPGLSSPRFTPDGRHIIVKNDLSIDGFSLMRPDGTDFMPVNARGIDLTDRAQGFAYVAHWIDP